MVLEIEVLAAIAAVRVRVTEMVIAVDLNRQRQVRRGKIDLHRPPGTEREIEWGVEREQTSRLRQRFEPLEQESLGGAAGPVVLLGLRFGFQGRGHGDSRRLDEEVHKRARGPVRPRAGGSRLESRGRDAGDRRCRAGGQSPVRPARGRWARSPPRIKVLALRLGAFAV